MTTTQKAIIGRLESIALPELAIADLQVRVDTGCLLYTSDAADE